MCITKPVYPICQSCGMPMGESWMYGINADGSGNEEFCTHCYQKGEFTARVDKTTFIDMQVKIAQEKMGMDEAQARQMAGKVIPTLKRWREQGAH